MSGLWQTIVYFEPHASCTESFLGSVIDSLLKEGFCFRNPWDAFQAGEYICDGDADFTATTDQEEAVTNIAERGQGAIVLHHPSQGIDVLLTLSPCKSDGVGRSDDANCEFGWVELSMEHSYLGYHAANSTVEERYRSLFRWSCLLARSTHAIYGWGDVERNRSMMDTTVRASDLLQYAVPRISWWSYFGEGFIANRGDQALCSSSSWAAGMCGEGFVVILHPPRAPMDTATLDELQPLGLL